MTLIVDHAPLLVPPVAPRATLAAGDERYAAKPTRDVPARLPWAFTDHRSQAETVL